MANGSLLPQARANFYDPNGNCLTGGLIHTYLPGGTTPKASFQDEAQTIANANPVPLDSAGSCLLYGSGSYSLAVTDALGVAVPAYSGVTRAPAYVSDALLPVVGATTLAAAATALSLNTSQITYTAPGAGAVAETIFARMSQTVSVKDYGAAGDGIADDTAKIAAAMVAGLCVYFPPGTYKITAPLVLRSNQTLFGAGMGASSLVASGNFTTVVSAPALISLWRLRDLAIDTSGTTTKALNVALDSATTQFAIVSRVKFTGNLASSLVYSAGVLIEFRDCGFFASTLTTCLQFDMNNLNSSVHGCWFIGGSVGVSLTKTGAAIAIQGVRISNNLFAQINGASNIIVGGAASYVFITHNVCDLVLSAAVVLGGGCTNIMVQSNYLGSNDATTGVGLSIDQTVQFVQIDGNQFGNQSINIVVGATVGARAGDILITNNNFAISTAVCLSLDSVNNCDLTNNFDQGGGAIASYQILRTHASGGAYSFGGNNWSSHAITTIDAASSYRALGPDRGPTFENKGVITSGGGTTLTVAHGCVIAPTVVNITQLGGAGMSALVSAIGPTTFDISYGTAGTPTFMWSCEVFV
jgi:hypothetical protein